MTTRTRKPPESRVAREARREDINNERAHALFPDEPPADIDVFRDMMARRINIFIGNRKRLWRACQEPACRRARACVAPRIRCSNAPPVPPDPTGRRLARAQAMFSRMAREVLAEREAAENASLAPPHPSRRAASQRSSP